MSEFLEQPSNKPIESLDGLVDHLKSDPPAFEDFEGEGFALNILPSEVGRTDAPKDSIPLGIGSLTLEQLKAVFSTMPVDLTFVDQNDRVRFVSEGPNRVFIRPPSVIGRKVQNCHPHGSLDRVEQILTDFKAGTQDIADFWMNFQGRFIFIRYFALRDENKHYMGTLEVTQDLTRERTLTGQRRLLEYDSPPTT